MSEQVVIAATAEHGGMYRVFVNGEQISQHVQLREAQESATNALLQDLDAEVYYDHDGYKVMLKATMRAAVGGRSYAGRIPGAAVEESLVAGTISATVESATSYSATGTLPEGGTGTGFSYQWHESTTSGFTPDGTTAISGATSQNLTTQTGKTEGVTYYLKRVVTDSGANTATSNQASVTPSSVSPLFSDGFETGDLTATGGGFSWGSATGANGAPSVRSTADDADVVPRTGTYALRFRYGATADLTDSSAEMNFNLGAYYSAVWVRYWIKFPSNWVYRDQTASATNNKFFQFKGAKNMLTVEMERSSSSVAYMRRFLSESENADGSNRWPTTDSSTPLFIGTGSAIPLDTWTEVGIYYKVASAAETEDGRAEVWLNGSLFHGLDWAFWDDVQLGKVNRGYIMGWANSGYDAETKILVDDIEFHTSAPAWWSAS